MLPSLGECHMPVSRWHIIVAAWVALASETSVAAEKVGEAVLIRTSVTGQGGALATRSPVHRDEQIRTSQTGLGEFLFRDGTKFAVGWNSAVTNLKGPDPICSFIC